jgi:hypothetical protein
MMLALPDKVMQKHPMTSPVAAKVTACANRETLVSFCWMSNLVHYLNHTICQAGLSNGPVARANNLPHRCEVKAAYQLISYITLAVPLLPSVAFAVTVSHATPGQTACPSIDPCSSHK